MLLYVNTFTAFSLTGANKKRWRRATSFLCWLLVGVLLVLLHVVTN